MGHVYGCRLEPPEENTLVTTYYDWSGADPAWKGAGIDAGRSEGAQPVGRARRPTGPGDGSRATPIWSIPLG